MPTPLLRTEDDLNAALAQVLPILRDRAAAIDQAGRYPRENVDLLHAVGLMALPIPIELGGFGIGSSRPFGLQSRIQQAIAAACSNTAQIFGAHSSALTTLRLIGSADQLTRFARLVIEEQASFCTVASEPGEQFTADGKRSPLRSTAHRVEGGWRVHARKSFATGSLGCRFALLTCAAQGQAGPENIVTAVVPADDPAVTIHDSWDNMGQRATTSGLLDVVDCAISDDMVIGAPGAARDVPVFAAIFQLGVASNLMGIAQGALDFAIAYLKEKRRPTLGFARAIDEPDVQRHIGDVATEIAAGRALVQCGFDLLDAGPPDEAAVSQLLVAVYQARIAASRISVDASSRIFELCGARATSRSENADRFWRNARTLSLHDNADKQRGIVGRHILGVESPRIASR